MNENLNRKPSGLTANGLRTWGMLFIALGSAGRAILQNTILGIGNISSAELLQLMQDTPDMMGAVTLSIVLEAVYACAAPIFAFLLVEGFCHCGNFLHYLLRVLGLAVVSEIPYNLAAGGSLWVTDSRNPVFGLVICLIILYFYRRYAEKSAGNLAIKALVTVAALIWTSMLRIDDGDCLVVLVAVIWAFRNKNTFRTIAGCTAAFVCTLFSPYYLAAPMSFLAIHFYNGEKGTDNKVVNYLMYPLLLIAVALAAMAVGEMNIL